MKDEKEQKKIINKSSLKVCFRESKRILYCAYIVAGAFKIFMFSIIIVKISYSSGNDINVFGWTSWKWILLGKLMLFYLDTSVFLNENCFAIEWMGTFVRVMWQLAHLELKKNWLWVNSLQDFFEGIQF